MLENKIRAALADPNYSAAKPTGVMKLIGLKRAFKDDFMAIIEKLVQAGEVKVGATGRLTSAKSPAGLLVGKVKRTGKGDGFVTLVTPPAGVTGEVFIDRRDMRDAQNGDTVEVRMNNKRRAEGQRCGAVEAVLERASTVFVGTYKESEGQAWVRIDGRQFDDVVWVGDPGAKGAKTNDKVVIEMLKFPRGSKPGEAVLTEVLGARGEVGVDTLSIIREFGLPDVFPETALAQARAQATEFDDSIPAGREDWTNELVVTIDPADARDFDDAISLKRTKAHGETTEVWQLAVHIADVSHFVPEGTDLDKAAFLRGTSVYLPGRVIPMLPEVVSNGLASLQEGRLRYTLSAIIEMTDNGQVLARRFARTAIRVTKRFAYEQVMPVIQGHPSAIAVEPAIKRLLEDMHGLAMRNRQGRMRRGAINLDLPETKLDMDADGRVTGAHEVAHDDSHQMIEEFMLTANVAVATYLDEHAVLFPRRAHPEPSPARLKAFGEFTLAMGFRLGTAMKRNDLKSILERVTGIPQERAIHYALLRSMKQAEYTPETIGHYALAEEQYCHFTSPIRRYPDLIVHRQLTAMIDGTLRRGKKVADAEVRPGLDFHTLKEMCGHCSATERRAAEAERELSKLKLLAFMEKKIGLRMEAVITGVDKFGFFCRGLEIPAEGLVHISVLEGRETFEHDKLAQRLIGRRSGKTYQLGDHVDVEVTSVDTSRRELNFELLTKRTKGSSSKSKRPHREGEAAAEPPRGPAVREREAPPARDTGPDTRRDSPSDRRYSAADPAARKGKKGKSAGAVGASGAGKKTSQGRRDAPTRQPKRGGGGRSR